MNEKGIELKNELIAKAEELANKEDSITSQEVEALKKRWRKASSEEESLAEKELNDKFDGFMSVIAPKVTDMLLSAEEKKNEIIKEAKEISTKSYKEATLKMNELMDKWKASGRTGDKEKDDALWAEFKAARDEFYANKKAYFENLKEAFAKNKEEKERLVEEAIKANELTNFKEISAKMDELMEAWKQLGSAGKEHEEELWAKFSEQRKIFFKNRKEYYKGLKETYAERTEAKKAIIAEAKQYLARSEFTDEEITAVKELRTKWKEVGSAGRENEDTLWEEFNGIVNKYYDNMRFYRNNR